MEYVGFIHSSPRNPNYGRASKKCSENFNPNTLTFSGNFTKVHRHFDIEQDTKRGSMRRDIMEAVMKRTESMISHGEEKFYVDDNPMYEDPKDVVVEKPPKPPRKRNTQALGMVAPSNKGSKSLTKEQKKKLTKKYEGLITALMDRCEENVVLISEKESQITKLKEKLKIVLDYNKLFAAENDQLKSQHNTLVTYIEECKKVLKEERDRNIELENKCKELGDRVKRFEVPDREHAEPTAIPLVEVCMSCSSRQVLLSQARDHSTRLTKDMQALKDVLYRLNVQLSRYQEKLRNCTQPLPDGKETVFKPGDKYEGLDSLITASIGYKAPEAGTTDEGHCNKSGTDEQTHTKVVDLSGLLSAQALAPLFDAYQENLQEKDNLIFDYEKQFEKINKKSKQIVDENKSLNEKVSNLEEELGQMRQSYKKLVCEKETADIVKATLVERAERAESKLKEVYELYEDKMAAMIRDYETIHREYFSVRSALETAEGRLAQAGVLRARTVPADLHERRLDSCKRLLEELKHQYTMENERKTEQLKKIEEQLKSTEEKYHKACQEHEVVKEELKSALKNVKLYRKAAEVFRERCRAAASRELRVRRRARRSGEPLRHALAALRAIQTEIREVKARAQSSLAELERRVVDQERRAAAALRHKEDVIRGLLNKVADVEEVRLSQINTHRLQGIVTDSSPERSTKNEKAKSGVKLVPAGGGYYQEKGSQRKEKG